MEKKQILKFFASWQFQTVIAAIFYTVGIVGHSSNSTYPLMVLLTPYVLLIGGIWVVIKEFKKPILLLWILVSYAITYSLEVLGVFTTKVFGPYYYGDSLGPKLLEVPVIIGFNWVIIVFSLALLGEWIVKKAFKTAPRKIIIILLSSLLGAILAVIFDILMEPAAVGLNYWFWTATADPFDIPLQNYIAWFIISFAFSAVLLAIPDDKRVTLQENPKGPWYVLIQAIFFVSLRIRYLWI